MLSCQRKVRSEPIRPEPEYIIYFLISPCPNQSKLGRNARVAWKNKSYLQLLSVSESRRTTNTFVQECFLRQRILSPVRRYSRLILLVSFFLADPFRVHVYFVFLCFDHSCDTCSFPK